MLTGLNLIMVIDINQNPVLYRNKEQINISIFLSVFWLTFSFADPF